MSSRRIRAIGVLGAGQMGRGIAQVGLQAGFQIYLVDCDQNALNNAKSEIEKGLIKFSEKKGRGGNPVDQMVECLSTGERVSDFEKADFVIEAVSENEALKKKLFGEMDSRVPPETVFASNTSSISISRLAQSTGRPDKVIGMHFMNPVPLMQLVEVIRAPETSQDTVEGTKALAQALGKEVVESKDSPGFILNRVLMPFINEAVLAFSEGIASAEDIDRGFVLGANHPMGPLALADLIGLDVCQDILNVLHREMKNPKYRPAPLLMEYVRSGRLGKKSGRGFYSYR